MRGSFGFFAREVDTDDRARPGPETDWLLRGNRAMCLTCPEKERAGMQYKRSQNSPHSLSEELGVLQCQPSGDGAR